jgi:molybdenum cofactor biosynthesis enzyme MoaA
MSFDQQIKIYEERIRQLEELKRTLLSKSGYFSVKNNTEVSENYLSRINVDLDENYQHMTILKIRKMMGFIPL